MDKQTNMNFRDNVLVAVTTCGAAPYVDLSLTKLKSFNLNCVVFDDGSFDETLQKVCDKHEVYLIGKCKPKEKHWYYGDYSSTLSAIRLADYCCYDFLLKISRRWIWLEDPIPSLDRLYTESGGSTFSNATRPQDGVGFGFRTDCFCIHVPTWLSVITDMENRLKTGDVGLVEAVWHSYAKKLQPDTELYKNYVKYNPRHISRTGYIGWDFEGNNSLEKLKQRLWHECNSLEDYYKVAKECNLPYCVEDFNLKEIRI